MRFLGACVGTVAAAMMAAAGAAGCNTGAGTLAGAGGGGTLSGFAGAGGRGGAIVVEGSGGAGFVGAGGAGPFTGAAGSANTGSCGRMIPTGRVSPDILIALDTSTSMNEAADGSCTSGCGGASKWSAAVAGIDSLLASGGLPVSWGLDLIGGGGDACDAGPIDLLTAPKNESAIMTVLAAHSATGNSTPAGNTPARAAVSVATSYFLGLPRWSLPTIVLITDGQPDCAAGAADPLASDAMGTIKAIADALSAGIPTYVIGLGALDPAAADALSRMAGAGGVPNSAPLYYPAIDATDIFNTINRVVAATAVCLFAVPPLPTLDGTTSRDDITVFVDGKWVPQDANDGWTYGDISHTNLRLQGSTCDAILAGTAREVEVVFPCRGGI